MLRSWPRYGATGCGDDVRAALGLVEVEVDVDEQAVAARARPIMAVKILARLRGFTVLPFRKASAFHVQLEALRPAAIRAGPAPLPARGPDLVHESADGPVHFWPV
jgi:hypothetical protein